MNHEGASGRKQGAGKRKGSKREDIRKKVKKKRTVRGSERKKNDARVRGSGETEKVEDTGDGSHSRTTKRAFIRAHVTPSRFHPCSTPTWKRQHQSNRWSQVEPNVNQTIKQRIKPHLGVPSFPFILHAFPSHVVRKSQMVRNRPEFNVGQKVEHQGLLFGSRA